MNFQMTSAAFQNGGQIPKRFACDGQDDSPALSWIDPPAGTKSLALIVDDPDAPVGTWVHWVLYDLPLGTRQLPEGVAKDRELPDGALQGRNDFGETGYTSLSCRKGAQSASDSMDLYWWRTSIREWSNSVSLFQGGLRD